MNILHSHSNFLNFMSLYTFLDRIRGFTRGARGSVWIDFEAKIHPIQS
jgi:hypothetical protein